MEILFGKTIAEGKNFPRTVFWSARDNHHMVVQTNKKDYGL